MSRPRRLLLAGLAWLLAQVATAGALDTLDECAARLAQEAPTAQGDAAALQGLCPDLDAALAELGLAQSLPQGWFNPAAVADLARLAHRYAEPPGGGPDTQALAGVLENLASEKVVPPRRSWWDAFVSWLDLKFGRSEPGAMPWLDRLLERLADSAAMLQFFTYAALAAAIALIGLLIVQELRGAGLLQRRRTDAGGTAVAPVAQDPLAGADLDAVPLLEQPALLLRLLVARLRANGQLQRDRSLTHAELVREGRFGGELSRVRFERVARLAERVLYGAGEPDPAQVGAVVGDGRMLLAELDTGTAQ